MNEMNLTGLVPMLETNEMAITRDFYCNTLGFTCESYSAEWGWMSLRNGEVAIMFSKPNQHRNNGTPAMSGSLYIQTSDVKQAWESLRDRVDVCYPIEDFEYGMREFAIYDNNGYTLQFGQPIEED